MNNTDQNKELNKDKGFAKCALKIYLQHFLIPERNETDSCTSNGACGDKKEE